ncbi:MAG: DUF616 domain-containing protein, partial [Eubacteriales bacterium]|nr:DUF616 domain-containing protein [Eubacteriales bacterium]
RYVMPAKTVVYTSLFGGYDQLLTPLMRSATWDYVCFTDDPNLTSDFWDIRLLPNNQAIASGLPAPDPQRQSREPKIRPHLFFPEYEASLYLDANLLIIGDIEAYIHTYQRHSPMLCVKHGERDCIYEELHACLEGRRDDPSLMIRQVERYRLAGMPAHFGLAVGSFIYREHNQPKVIDLMELWWQELSTNSKRDQLSLAYCVWQQNFPVDYYYGNNWNNDYFIWLPHRIQNNPFVTRLADFVPSLASFETPRIFPDIDRSLDQRNLMAAKVYFDFGQGLSESNVLFVPPSFIKGQNYYCFKLPANVHRIRFDPIEGHSCLISKFNLKINDHLITTWQHNAQAFNEHLFFSTTDPNFEIFVDQLACDVTITLKMLVIRDQNLSLLLSPLNRG